MDVEEKLGEEREEGAAAEENTEQGIQKWIKTQENKISSKTLSNRKTTKEDWPQAETQSS